MASVNKVILVGNLGQDPEVKTWESGKKVVNLSVATSDTWKDKNSGDKKEKTEWHRIVIFGNGDSDGLAGVAEKYLKKGSKVYVEGKLQTRKWKAQDGSDRYSTEVVLQGFGAQLVLLDRTEGSGRPPPPESEDDYGRESSRPTRQAADHASMDDDIPF